MKTFVDWVSHHEVTVLLIGVTAYAVLYVITRRKKLFYRE